MSRTIARALITCMSEGRSPRPYELETVAARIWREAFCHAAPVSWASVPIGSADHRRTIAAASAALGYAQAA